MRGCLDKGGEPCIPRGGVSINGSNGSPSIGGACIVNRPVVKSRAMSRERYRSHKASAVEINGAGSRKVGSPPFSPAGTSSVSDSALPQWGGAGGLNLVFTSVGIFWDLASFGETLTFTLKVLCGAKAESQEVRLEKATQGNLTFGCREPIKPVLASCLALYRVVTLDSLINEMAEIRRGRVVLGNIPSV